MITIENMNFLQEEVLVKKQSLNGAKEANAFSGSNLPQDKSAYVYAKVLKVGKNQTEVKAEDNILVSEQLLQKIDIREQGSLENVYKIISDKQIFAVIC